MKKIKVLHLLSTNKFSGAESVAFDIILNTSNLFEYAYCSPDGPIRIDLNSNKINFLPLNKLKIRDVRQIIKKYNPDIIHAHDFRSSFIASLCKGKCKLISHIHNNSPWIKRICLKSFVFLYSSLKADKIFIVSNSIKDEYIFSRIIANKCICLDNPVLRKKVLEKVDNLDNNYKYDICCVARLTEAKDPGKFLNIIHETKKTNSKIKVVWIGDGELKEYVSSLCDKMKLSDNIDFLGYKNNPYTYVKQSKIFLLTSKWEGYGLAAFEALTLGKPCVVSNVGGLKNIVDNDCGKLCNPNNINDYVNEINMLLSDINYYNHKSESALKKSISLDNEDIYFKKIESEYLNILNKEE